MRLSAVELRICELELVVPLAASGMRHLGRPVILVRLVPEDGPEGWGECGALAEPTYTAEHAAGAAAVLAEHLVPLLLAGGPLSGEDAAADALSRLAAIRGHPMAKAALEMAVLDAGLRAAGRSLAAYLGAVRLSVPGGATVSIGAPDEVVAAAAAAVAAGYGRVKCKIGPGRDVDSVAAVRRQFPELAVSVDANGAYRLDDPAHRRALDALDALGLSAIEQPLAAEELAGHAELARALETPILLDESIEDEADLQAAIRLGALDGLSVKPGRMGGIAAAARACETCRAAGLRLAIGGLFETGLARAAHLAVAALPGFDLPGDLGASDRYFAPDLTAPHRLEAGQLAVPDGPGIGAVPDPLALDRATRAVARAGAGRGVGEALSWAPAGG